MHNEVEIRCPLGNQRMFGKLLVDSQLSKESPRVVEGNLVEFSCSECKRTLHSRGMTLSRVLHRYNILGELVESILVD